MATLPKINTALLGLIILVNGYVIVMPIVPLFGYYAPGHTERRQQLTTQILHTEAPTAAPQPSQPDTLTVPAMLLEQPVLEGRDTYAVLNQGLLHWPASSTPDKGGNTVILGHRFTYHNPKGVFYYLDKVKVGDEVGLVWDSKSYVYQVSEIKVVDPTDIGILQNTKTPQLTLFTCTPLLWPKDRLVVVAKQIIPTVAQPKEVTP